MHMPAPPFDQYVTFLYTEDLSATAAFYEDMLGLPLILDQGLCRIYRVSADGFLGFCERGAALGQGYTQAALTDVILTFVTVDVDGLYARLKEKGVPFEKTPAHNPKFNIYHCFLRDPNGYLLEIQTFLDPAWPASAAKA